jgi:hypothetical protein
MNDSTINILLIIAATIISVSFIIGAIKTIKRIDNASYQKPKQIKVTEAHSKPMQITH